MKEKPFKTPVQWDVNISILRNPLLWYQLFIVVLVSNSYLVLLLVGINLFEYHWQDIPASLSIGSFVAGGFFLAFSLMLFLMYWRGIPTTYILQDGYIEQHTLSPGKKATGLLSIFGILSGKSAGYTAAGATLLAQSREQISVKWEDATHLEVFPKRNEIQLHDDWHTVMQVVCPKGQFGEILRFIEEKTEQHSNPKKPELCTETSFVKKVILSIFALIFGFFLFPRLPIHYVGAFAIATIIFALLTLWSKGYRQRLFSWILFLLPIIGVALAFVVGEVDMHRSGAIYALLIEILLLLYFMGIGLAVIFKYIK